MACALRTSGVSSPFPLSIQRIMCVFKPTTGLEEKVNSCRTSCRAFFFAKPSLGGDRRHIHRPRNESLGRERGGASNISSLLILSRVFVRDVCLCAYGLGSVFIRELSALLL